MPCTVRLLSVLLITALVVACSSDKDKTGTSAKEIKFTVQNALPHDTAAFTEGFVIHQGQLYESTGLNPSWMGVLDTRTGIAKKKVTLDAKYFGEGITILNNKIYQLTWKNMTGFVYKVDMLEPIDTFTYNTEGWGLTTDGSQLIMSDGTNKLRWLDTTSFQVTRTLNVTSNGLPLNELNELEYIDGKIFANVWKRTEVVVIDPATGEVTGFLDLSLLMRQAQNMNPDVDVLNGIAWHDGTKTLLVTGKYWSRIYILKLDDTKETP